jgi:hypothetical protein
METDVARLGLAAAHDISELLMIAACSIDGVAVDEPGTQSDLDTARRALFTAIRALRELRSCMERFGATPSALSFEEVAKNTWFPKAAVEHKGGS